MDLLHVVGDDTYISEEHVIAREYGPDPTGEAYKGKWVLREYRTGVYLDHDSSRHDLAERNKVKIIRI